MNVNDWLQVPGLPVVDPSSGEDQLAVVATLVAGCTTRLGGVSTGIHASNNMALHVGDDAQRVETNRAALQAHLDATRIQWLDQVHGHQCFHATGSAEAAMNAPPVADVMWTDAFGVALAIITADCAPLLMWARDGSVVGAAHAGWRGLSTGVIGALVDNIPVRAEDLCVWIGPCIGVTCYEVGEDVWSYFAESDSAAVCPHRDDPHKRMLNLSLIAEHELRRCGVGRIVQSGLCSYSAPGPSGGMTPRFFSYRRCRHEGHIDTGRMASVIMRQPVHSGSVQGIGT